MSANYCGGDCPYGLGHDMNFTNHALVQMQMHLHNPQRYGRPKCAPVQYRGLPVLYLDDGNNVVMKKYKNMIATPGAASSRSTVRILGNVIRIGRVYRAPRPRKRAAGLCASEQTLDIAQFQRDIGGAPVVALPGKGRFFHLAQQRVHLLGAHFTA